MTVLIQRSDNHYFCASGNWFPDRSIARRFSSSIEALTEAIAHGLKDATLVFVGDPSNHEYDVRVPLFTRDELQAKSDATRLKNLRARVAAKQPPSRGDTSILKRSSAAEPKPLRIKKKTK